MDRDFFLKEVCDVFHLTLEEKVTALLAGVVVVEVEAEDETVDTDRTGGWVVGIVSAGESNTETRSAQVQLQILSRKTGKNLGLKGCWVLAIL